MLACLRGRGGSQGGLSGPPGEAESLACRSQQFGSGQSRCAI